MSTSNNGGHHPPAPNPNASKKRSVDVLLQRQGKNLQVGEQCRVRLIKGPNRVTTKDPVDKKAPHSQFPLIAKFPVSVVKPDFTKQPWNTGRLYQQDIPKPVDDSDDEETAAANAEGQRKKRWKYNRQNEQAARQWILQEQVDFLETMVSRREKKLNGAEDDKYKLAAISSRYEGFPEHNASNYAILRISRQPDATPNSISVQLLPKPPVGFVNFQQPAARRALTLSQAEQVIQDQRSGIRTLQWERTDHEKIKQQQSQPNQNNNNQQQPQSKKPLLGRMGGNTKNKSIKDRLLKKLKSKEKDDDIDEGDDVMGDVAFRSRKGAGSARRELLTSLGDGLTVSDEGVLGGGNDTAFGGKQRFGKLQTENDAKAGDRGGGEEGGGESGGAAGGQDEKQERGADGAAMADDFYTRDVSAEYEELDYDANEQFDDDDVDLGEAEVVVENQGFGDDDEEDDDLDDDEVEEEGISGAEGLASVAGFKALLAKARGEQVPEKLLPPGENGEKADGADAGNNAADPKSALGKARKNKKEEQTPDHMSKILEAADKAATKRKSRAGGEEVAAPGADNRPAQRDVDAQDAQMPSQRNTAATSTTDIQVDEHGLRIVTQTAVQREIWLNHGAIEMKRLMKLFDVKKKSSQARQNQFRDVVRELCTMRSDPIKGRMLVLKQHYSNMP